MKISYLKQIKKRIREGILQDMLRQTRWIYDYARHYWWAMILYTALGLTGTILGLGSSIVSKNLVDIITGHETGELIRTFCMMVGLSVSNIFISQITNYASSWISMKVDADIKADIFSKMLVTDWESITNYHTGDLLTRWSSDASNISNGILNWIPNLIINIFKFISFILFSSSEMIAGVSTISLLTIRQKMPFEIKYSARSVFFGNNWATA